MSAKVLHERLNLYALGNDVYTFEPASTSRQARSLTINRLSGDIILNASSVRVPGHVEPTTTVYGIMGLLSLSTSDFLVLITARERCGRFLDHDIFRATDFKVLPLDNASRLDSPVESHLMGLVHAHLDGGMFFFSYTWDVTRRLQSHWVTETDAQKKALWEQADDRFFWNKYLQSRFIDITVANPDQDLSPYILPVMYGTFDIRSTSINNQPFEFCLISRRSRYRAGTRYFTRGIDEDGHVANYNETEQIVLYEGQGPTPEPSAHHKLRLSFVQIRGSVPVFWAEINTLRYKPDLQIMNLPATIPALRTHLKEQLTIYGSQSLVNLVDQKGHEKPVKEAYESSIAEANIPNVSYQYFDFHNECKRMRWDRISNLIDRLEDDLTAKGYFHHDLTKNTPVKLQLGTIRTNCMDNLDRTNVVQSALAKWTLSKQLRAIGILQDMDSVDNHSEFMNIFRQLWADHADAISRAYGGSGALKTDFTRTGKRTRLGALQDGYNSTLRYLKNNYFDGARQDAFDLMTGTWVPRRGPLTALSLIVDTRPLIIRSMPYVFFFSIFMVCAGLTLPRSSDYSLKYYFIFWLALAAIAYLYICAHGIDYVSWPRLNPPVDAIYYEGPGFRSGQHGKGFNLPAALVGKRAKSAAGMKWLQPGQSRLKTLATHKMEEIEMGTKKRVD